MSLPPITLELIRDTVRTLDGDATLQPLRWHAMLKLALSEHDWHKAEAERLREHANAQRDEVVRLQGLIENLAREGEHALDRTAD